ncbi:MAG TPA: 2Fe-2S iron-sulfur cluster-binding protein [Thermoleophilia bacterium]|nr:2Fe-2S iron-sulfur cluster-binding protein [Thermoleophilia bacterium]
MSGPRVGRQRPAPRPVEGTPPAAEFTFLFEGRPITAREGDTVAAALIANGVHVFGRSSKYHRPRGYRCGRGHCSSCAMRVDGLPGVRTCVTPVRAGMTVEREHAWPGADRDLLRAADALSTLMPPGFYYRWFRGSPRLWGAFERGLAQVAGQGEMPSPEAVDRLGAARCERRPTDVLVVGGGAAGMSAALAAAGAGAQVLLVHRGDRLGGGLADDVPAGSTIAAALAERAANDARLEVITGADAFAWYEEGAIAVDRRPDLLLVDPAAVVLATGAYDTGLPFPNWDLPGVMTATAARRLMSRCGVLPGSRVAFVTSDDRAYTIALQLAAGGVEVACIADYRVPEEGGAAAAGAASRSGSESASGGASAHPVADRDVLTELAACGVDLLTGLGSVTARGFTRVRSVTLRAAERPGGVPRRARTYACDTICYAAGARPADDLAYQALCRGSVVLSALGAAPGAGAAAGPLLAGFVAGFVTPAEAIAHGEAAGTAAAHRVRRG